jgi:hypothetical protein
MSPAPRRFRDSGFPVERFFQARQPHRALAGFGVEIERAALRPTRRNASQLKGRQAPSCVDIRL